ncbi:MAG: hypothetical protein U1F50_01355 [Rubrivivax sp.]
MAPPPDPAAAALRPRASLAGIRGVKAEAEAPPRRAAPPLPARSASAEPYRAYQPRPFTKAERAQVTVLYGGLHWRAERVIQGVFENLGYNARPLPPATLADLLKGREVADIGQCCPTSFTAGNLANFLAAEAARIGREAVAERYVYMTAGACGSCRFGQYHQSYELALRNGGLEAFRMFLMGQGGVDQGATPGGGLELNAPLLLGAVWSLMATDVLQDLEYRVRPYEKNPGDTDRAVQAAVELLYNAMKSRPPTGGGARSALWHLGSSHFTRVMQQVRALFEGIELDRLRVKPVVKITGEFYLQTVEGEPNHYIHRWLEREGAEVYPAAVTVWFDYLMRLAVQRNEDRAGLRAGARRKAWAVGAGQRLLRWSHERLRRAAGGAARELPLQHELRELAAPWFHSRLTGGEGDMLVGKALWAFKHHKAHMVCELSPYSCMPNTMSIGAMAAVQDRHPELLYAPIEIKGDSEVHALSRCQMILTEAKQRARREYAQVLERIGRSEEEIRAAAAKRPELARAATPIPHHGVAGSAANFALHVAKLEGWVAA